MEESIADTIVSFREGRFLSHPYATKTKTVTPSGNSPEPVTDKS